MIKRCLTLKDVSAITSLSIATLNRIIARRELASYKLAGRRLIDAESLEKYLNARMEREA
jgi:excisionase family DNA binding protein